MWTEISYYDLLTKIKNKVQPQAVRLNHPTRTPVIFTWLEDLEQYANEHLVSVIDTLLIDSDMTEDEMFNSQIGLEYYEDPLTPFERNWLKNYIEPFREKVDLIEKRERGDDEVKAVWIMVYCEGEDIGSTPLLPDDMFKGLEANTGYTLEDLEL